MRNVETFPALLPLDRFAACCKLGAALGFALCFVVVVFSAL